MKTWSAAAIFDFTRQWPYATDFQNAPPEVLENMVCRMQVKRKTAFTSTFLRAYKAGPGLYTFVPIIYAKSAANKACYFCWSFLQCDWTLTMEFAADSYAMEHYQCSKQNTADTLLSMSISRPTHSLFLV